MNSSLLIRRAVVLLFCCLITNVTSGLWAQISVTINSLADDGDAFAWDNPDTPDVDESADGTCLDQAGRCTLRAAIEEAWNMNDHMGVPIDITLNINGDLVLDVNYGGFNLPSHSHLHGNNLTTIVGGDSNVTILGLLDTSIVTGINFRHGEVLIAVQGDRNIIAGNVLHDAYSAGVLIGGQYNVIGRGNIIYSAGRRQIFVPTNDNVIKGNIIGIDANGDSVQAANFGIEVYGDNNVIGGSDPGDRNIISGNDISGIMIRATTGDPRTTIIGNYIGTDITGTQSRANNYGIQIFSGRVTVGGPAEGDRNIISGNKSGGIEAQGEVLDTRIIGNTIGADVSGMPLGNGFRGVVLSPGTYDCTIEGNSISYNGFSGIEIAGRSDLPSWNHRIRGNTIRRNGQYGIEIGGTATDIVIGSSLTQEFSPNIIDSNGTNGLGAGVSMGHYFDGVSRTNTVRKNVFGQNAERGILIDPSFQDQIRPPTIKNYTDLGGGQAIVAATHHRRDALIDVYAAQRNQNGKYEGLEWVGSGTVTDSMVPTVISISSCNCGYLVATATDPLENTSEFSDSLSTSGATDAGNIRSLSPEEYFLEDAYPNPFNPSTTIRYSLPAGTYVTLRIFDITGREVVTLVDRREDPGYKSVRWEAKGLSSGLYICRLQAGNFTASRKLLLAK